jgi:hypothetical protein
MRRHFDLNETDIYSAYSQITLKPNPTLYPTFENRVKPNPRLGHQALRQKQPIAKTHLHTLTHLTLDLLDPKVKPVSGDQYTDDGHHL